MKKEDLEIQLLLRQIELVNQQINYLEQDNRRCYLNHRANMIRTEIEVERQRHFEKNNPELTESFKKWLDLMAESLPTPGLKQETEKVGGEG